MNSAGLTPCIADWKMVLEYLKVFLGWPFMALIMGVCFITLFRTPIGKLIENLRELDFFGAKAKTGPPIDQTQPPPAPSPALTTAVAVADGKAGDEPSPLLLQTYEQYRFERAFNVIFGTQWALLNYTRAQGGYGSEDASVMQFVNQHNALRHDASASAGPVTREQYLYFLITEDLIVVTADRRAVLTPRGERFVAYILRNYAPPPWRAL